MSTAPAAAVVVCPIQDHRVVVPASRVDAIGEERDASSEGAAITDLASVLGVAPPDGPRRALRVLAGGAPRWLVIGDRLSVHRVTADAFVEFPAWLGGSSALRAFVGLVAVDGAFALELDVARVLDGEVA